MKNNIIATLVLLVCLLFTNICNSQIVNAPPPPPPCTYYGSSSPNGQGIGTYYGQSRYYFTDHRRYDTPNANQRSEKWGALIGGVLIGMIGYSIYENIVEQKAVWNEGGTEKSVQTTPLLGWKYIETSPDIWTYQQTVVGYTWWDGNKYVTYNYPQN